MVVGSSRFGQVQAYNTGLIYRTGDMASGMIRSKTGGLPRMSRTPKSCMQSIYFDRPH
jgi:hypothetical protein